MQITKFILYRNNETNMQPCTYTSDYTGIQGTLGRRNNW